MKIKKLILIASIAGILSNSGCQAVTLSNNQDYEKQSYIVLAKLLYDQNNYLPFRLEIIERLAYLKDIKTNFSLKDNYNEKIYRDLISAKEKKIAKIDKPVVKVENLNLNIKVEKLREKDNSYASYLFSDLLDSEEQDIKRFAKQIVDNMQLEESLDVFNQLVKSAREEDRLTGLSGLHRLKAKNFPETAMSMFNSASNAEKKLIIEALIDYNDDKIHKFATKIVNDQGSDYSLKVNAFIILVNSGEKQYLDDYKGFITSDVPEKSRYAALRMSKINMPFDFDFVDELSSSLDPILRIGALSIIDKSKDYYLKTEDKKVFEVIERMVNDEAELVQYSATKLAATVKDKRITKILKPLIYSPDSGINAINIIFSTDNKYLVPVLYELTKNENDEIKFQAAKNLNYYGKNIKNIIKKMAQYSSNSNVRISSSILIDKLDSNDKYLKQIYATKDLEISEIATLYLADSKNNKEFVKDLDRIAKQNCYEGNDLIAALLLLKYDEETGLDIIRKYLSARKPISIGLEKVREDVLTKLSSDTNEWVQINSAYNLAKIGNQQGLSVLRKFLDSDNYKLRAAAAFMIGEIGKSEEIPELTNAFDDKYARVKANAAFAALEILDRNTKQSLRK